MTNKCWVPECKSGYKTCKERRSLFKAPKDEARLMIWQRNIPKKGTLTSKHFICDLHFDEQYILKTFTHIINGETVSIDRDVWALKDDAIPTLFPNLPFYLSKKTIQKRRPLNRNNVLATSNVIESISETPHVLPLEESFEPNETSTTQKTAPNDKKKPNFKNIQHLKREIYGLSEKSRRQFKTITHLRKRVQILEKNNAILKSNQLNLEKLPKIQRTIIEQSVKNVEAKGSTGNRYSVEFIMDCLLLKVKSHSTYVFLRDNGYMSLPSISTLNRHIKALKPNFGFQPQLFVALKTKLATLPINEKRGMLLFDEVQISKHLDYRPHEGKIIGKVNYGDETDEKYLQEDGDHALVFLFRPHFGGWIQAIGTFCAGGATPATVLAKLILQATIHLHECGARIDGYVCDGASTNRSAFTSLGWCGSAEKLVNSISHPCAEKQKIFFFSDTCHLFKCIRNNLVKATKFELPDGTVEHSFYRTLLDIDLNKVTSLRLVPKLTEAHITPNNFQKMSVSLATQLFSNAVADGLELYEKSEPRLQKATATIKFTRKMNRLFDLLNGRRPVEGIRNQDTKLTELEDSLVWLNKWENHSKLISLPKTKPSFFLSRQTCSGLRTTLRSTIDLCKVLLSEGFSYVLTSKFNQDPLERFFGMIRQSCGGDDHPTPNQFLFVYRLLSVASLIKPPKRGSVEYDTSQVLLPLYTLPKTEKITPLQNLEARIDSLLENWESNNKENSTKPEVFFPPIPDHTYTQSTPEACILYYLGGYVACKISKGINCDKCIKTLKEDNVVLSGNSALVEIKTRGRLAHPTPLLEALIMYIEVYVQQYSADPNAYAFENIINGVFSSEKLAEKVVGCSKHFVSLTAKTINFFVTARLHFICKNKNKNREARQKKKKYSKLSKLT